MQHGISSTESKIYLNDRHQYNKPLLIHNAFILDSVRGFLRLQSQFSEQNRRIKKLKSSLQCQNIDR